MSVDELGPTASYRFAGVRRRLDRPWQIEQFRGENTALIMAISSFDRATRRTNGFFRPAISSAKSFGEFAITKFLVRFGVVRYAAQSFTSSLCYCDTGFAEIVAEFTSGVRVSSIYEMSLRVLECERSLRRRPRQG